MSVHVNVRYFAAAKAATGVGQEILDLPDGSTVHDLMAHAVAQSIARMGVDLRSAGADPAAVFARCTVILDGQTVEDSAPLSDGARLDVLPPFAGG